MAGPPFERYPAPPAGRRDVYRVISPYRDALAWVSISGKLALVRLMVREGDGWRTLVDEALDEGHATSLWTFVERDPVELRFRTGPDVEIDAAAFVTVSRDGCLIGVETGATPKEVGALIEAGAWLTVEIRTGGS